MDSWVDSEWRNIDQVWAEIDDKAEDVAVNVVWTRWASHLPLPVRLSQHISYCFNRAMQPKMASPYVTQSFVLLLPPCQACMNRLAGWWGVSPFAALQLTCCTRWVGVRSADKNRNIMLHKEKKMEMSSSGSRVGEGFNGRDTGDNGGGMMWILIPCINSCNAHGYFNNGLLLLCSHADSQPILNYSNTLGNI